jgi:hypothetical protein
MPARKFSGLAALLQIDAERDALDVRAKAARAAAASELGEAVLDAVGPALAPAELAELLRAAQRLGMAQAMALLGGSPKACQQVAGSAATVGSGRANGAGNGADHAAH